MNKRMYWVLTGFIASLGLMAGCGGETKQGTENQNNNAGNNKVLKIAVIPKGTTHQYWKTVHAGAEKAAQELGVEVLWQGPQKEDDRQLQIQVVQNFVSRGVDAIVLAPLDARSLVPPVKAAIAHKIPVIIFDSGLSAEGYASYVSTNNIAAGRLCAKRMSEVMGGKGKAILLRYSEGSASTHERETGFLEGMKEYGPGIELISTDQYAGATMEKAFQTSQNLLNKFGNAVEGIFCANESSTQGMLRALQTSNRAGKVKLVGFDMNDALLAGLKNGEIVGLAVQDPFRMGYESVKTAIAVVKGGQYEKTMDTGVVMVTKENLIEPTINALINPDLKKWLNE